jgi:hypothetical protein
MLLTFSLSSFMIISIILLTFGPQIGGWIPTQGNLG